MKTIILAGGMGTRLRSVVQDVPKPMAPVAGRPFLAYLLQQVKQWGCREVILSVGYKAHVVRNYFGDGARWGVKIVYAEEPESLGTGGAIRDAARAWAEEKTVLTMNGDSFLEVDFRSLREHHETSGAAATLALACVKDTSRYGSVTLEEDGSVLGFHEKGRSGEGTINGGVYLLEPSAIEEIPMGTVSLESEVLPRLVPGRLHGVPMKGFFIDMGLPEDYASLCAAPERLLSALERGK